MPEEPVTGTTAPDSEAARGGLITDAAIVVAPSAAVVVNHLLNRPKQEKPNTDVVLPPGVKKD